jgi:1-acyl-sn-glycerol-3-phosphate acyltransferase
MQTLSQDDSSYLTKPVGVSLFARIFPSLSFYQDFLRIIFRGSRLAQKGVYEEHDWWASSVEVVRALEKVGVSIQVTGLDVLKEAPGPVVFVGNHLSVLETVVLPAQICPYTPVTFVIKQSLVDMPVFKHIIRSRQPIVVTRTNPRQDLKTVLEQGCDRLSKGISVIIFPQTTRADFDPEQFSTIAIKLAKRANVPVIPLALLTDAWENGRLMKDFGKIKPSRQVHFAFGEPLRVEGKGSETHQAVLEYIQNHLERWQA